MVFSLKKAMKTTIYGLPRTFGLRTKGSTEFARQEIAQSAIFEVLCAKRDKLLEYIYIRVIYLYIYL
jgi:hypothetical protein